LEELNREEWEKLLKTARAHTASDNNDDDDVASDAVAADEYIQYSCKPARKY
jgi:hypothetical protein